VAKAAIGEADATSGEGRRRTRPAHPSVNVSVAAPTKSTMTGQLKLGYPRMPIATFRPRTNPLEVEFG
jgi:hypothetical protein